MSRSSEPKGDGTMPNGQKIQQLIPAGPGWWVRYRDRSRPDHEWVAPVAAWALGEDARGYQRIYGVDPTADDWHSYGDVVDQDVVYFYSPDEPAENTSGVGDPGPSKPGR